MPKKHRNDLTAGYVRARLKYNPDTGVIRWRKTGNSSWDTQHAGKPAGSRHCAGYRQISISSPEGTPGMYLVHRVIWLYMMGEWPIEVDHINGIKSDNRWVNLREATRSQNACNIVKSSINTSGQKGVDWHETAQRWRVRVRVRGKEKTFGYYRDFEEACEVARKAREDLHGEYANHG